MKLYDLISLSQQDSGIKPGQGHRETGTEGAGKASENTETPGTEKDNPFPTPVSMLQTRQEYPGVRGQGGVGRNCQGAPDKLCGVA